MTPEQQAEAAKRREAEMNAPRPIAARRQRLDRRSHLDGSARRHQGRQDHRARSSPGGVESNGPHLATGKHNFVLKVMGEAIARKLGNALVAPIVTLEPGRPDADRVAPGSVFLSAATYRAVLTDMATSLKGMGFTNVILMGDSGGNQGAMKEVAAALDEKYKASGTRFYFIPEYYDYSSVQKLIKDSGIPEQIEIGASQGSDRIHEEYGIDALMALYDPKSDPHRRAHQGKPSNNQRLELATDEQDARDGQEDRRAASEVDRRRRSTKRWSSDSGLDV